MRTDPIVETTAGVNLSSNRWGGGDGGCVSGSFITQPVNQSRGETFITSPEEAT